MWRSKHKDENQPRTETAQCPVCKAILGKRDCETVFMAHCEECKATFYWKPWADKPSVKMDKDTKKAHRYCDRNGCYCHE